MSSKSLVCVCWALMSAAAFAQYPASANGLQWTGVTSTAGTFCWGFSCVPGQANVVAGETGTLMIRGFVGESYMLGISTSVPSCVTVPLAYNQLVLAHPITIFSSGPLSQISAILACPPAFETLTVSIPPLVPSGTQFTVQGFTSLTPQPGNPMLGSFTQAITFIVL